MTARRHHYIRQCYLKGFVKHRQKPKLFIVDIKERRTFCAATANVAVERDFHGIHVESASLDAIENAFSRFEGELSQALARIAASRSIKSEEDRALLFNLVGLIAIKNPQLRETIRDAREHELKVAMQLATETPERWNFLIKRAREVGVIEPSSDISYDKIKEYIRKWPYELDLNPMEHLKRELDITKLHVIICAISSRKWILFKAPPKTTGFITSDHPTCLMWSDPAHYGTVQSPGLALAGTSIYFPISNDLAMIGAFEAEEMEVDATPFQIAQINGAVIARARRQIYACDSNFPYVMQPSDKIRSGETLLNDRRIHRDRA